MKNKNILLVISKFPPEYSGPGVRIPRLYKWLEEKGYNFKVNVICNGIELILNEEYMVNGLPVRRITAETLNKLFLLLKFIPKRVTHNIIYQAEFIKTFVILMFSKSYKNIDFLHIAGHSGGTAAALLWAKLKKIPVLLELVNASAKPYQKFLYIFKVSIPETGKIAFLTQASADLYPNIDACKKWIKPNPVDIKIFYQEANKENIRKELIPFKENDIVIMSVAKFMPRKNQLFLISVLKLLPEKYKLVIAGPSISQGPNYKRDKIYLDSIFQAIKENNISNRIKVISEYVEADQYMKAADLYVMPAWNEGLGTPMLEAMACGLPVVANEAEAAFQEWIVNGENGFLANINSAEEWADCLIKASRFSDAQKKDIANKIRLKISQEKIFSEYEEIFKNYLEL